MAPTVHGIMKPRAHMAMWIQGFIIPSIYGYNVYGTSSVTIWKTRHKVSVDIRIFLQCIDVTMVTDLVLTTRLVGHDRLSNSSSSSSSDR